jgi:hypothetical protein
MKKMIEVEVFKCSTLYGDNDNWPTESLLGFRDWVNEVIKSIPEEYRSIATFVIDHTNDNTYIEVGYKREETDKEERDREERKSAKELEIETRERKILAVLKAKYEGSTNEH